MAVSVRFRFCLLWLGVSFIDRQTDNISKQRKAERHSHHAKVPPGGFLSPASTTGPSAAAGQTSDGMRSAATSLEAYLHPGITTDMLAGS